MDPINEKGWKKLNVLGGTDPLVKSGKGKLHNITVNGITAVGDVIVYDGIDATGVIIATLILRSAVQVSCQPITLNYDCEIDTGIFIDTTSSSFTGNLTVTYI